MSELTKLHLPSTLPFPITITSVLIREGFQLRKHQTVLKYKYLENQIVPLEKLEPEELERYNENNPKIIKVESIGSFESPIEGKLVQSSIKVGDVFKSEKDKEIGAVEEACTHPVQYGGLCGICGADLTEDNDYSGYNNTNRAPISMSHQNTQLTVSVKEAARIEKNSTKSLIQEKKLILVVDLDQTVIQTTNDPTVYAWQQDSSNPNYAAVKDVKSFFLMENYRVNNVLSPNKRKSWYYVKLRPGLTEFFEKLNSKYEMHIYTMATRDYAEQIAKIIDPNGIYFGDRILSRDESGSITQKSLHRLFPTNTSMVVIIDDRADVWQWSPNLIKVLAYDFFIGIGDINSGFLPKQQNLIKPVKKRKVIDEISEDYDFKDTLKEEPKEEPTKEESLDQESNGDVIKKDFENEKPVDSVSVSSNSIEVDPDKSADDVKKDEDFKLEVEESSKEAALIEAESAKRFEYLNNIESERPLAKLQEKLQEKIEEEEKEQKSSEINEKKNIDMLASTGKDLNLNGERKNSLSSEDFALLIDDDTELTYLQKILLNVHEKFYEEYKEDKINPPDIKYLMPEMKSQVLGDTRIVFSGLFPTNIRMKVEPEIITLARSFGASVDSKISNKVTHIVGKTSKTAKARLAKSLYGEKVKVVRPDWLFSCFSRWKEVSTDEFEIPFDERDLVEGKELEAMKNEIYEAEEAENFAMIEHIDLTGADQELAEFLNSDDDNENEESEQEKNDQFNHEFADIHHRKRRNLLSNDNEEYISLKRQKLEDSDASDANDEELSDADFEEFDFDLEQE